MRQDNAALASMVTAVDDSVGVLLSKLKELKLDQNTVVIFFSDNGGLSTLQGNRIGPGCNLPLRASKGWLYEGGVREPTLIRAPGITQPGSVSHKPMISMDFPYYVGTGRVAFQTQASCRWPKPCVSAQGK